MCNCLQTFSPSTALGVQGALWSDDSATRGSLLWMRLYRRMPQVIQIVLSEAISRHVIPSVPMGPWSHKCLSVFIKKQQVRIGFGHGVSSVFLWLCIYYWIKQRILRCCLWVHPNYFGVKNHPFLAMDPKYNITPLTSSCGMVTVHFPTGVHAQTCYRSTHFLCNAKAKPKTSIYGNCFAAITENLTVARQIHPVITFRQLNAIGYRAFYELLSSIPSWDGKLGRFGPQSPWISIVVVWLLALHPNVHPFSNIFTYVPSWISWIPLGSILWAPQTPYPGHPRLQVLLGTSAPSWCAEVAPGI